MPAILIGCREIINGVNKCGLHGFIEKFKKRRKLSADDSILIEIVPGECNDCRYAQESNLCEVNSILVPEEMATGY